MAPKTPVVVIFDSAGVAMAVQAGSAIPAGTSSLLVAAKDGSGNAQDLLVDNSGNLKIALPTGAATEATLATRLADATFTARINTLGQKNSANSTPVVIASDQSNLTVVGAGVAGTPSGGVVSVQGVAGGTAQPISAASLPLPSGAATEATLATRLADATFTARINTLGQKNSANSTPVVIASDQSSFPVNQGTAAAVAGAWPSKITDGTNVAAVKAASTSPVAADPALVVAISPNSVVTVTATEASIGVNGAASPGSSTQVGGKDGSGNLQPIKVSSAGVISVDGSAVTQPVSAASLPLPTGAATEATLATRLADATFTSRINTLGQKNSANSTPVVIASDQSTLNVAQATAANLNAQVQGAAASGAAKSGNPVQTGGVFNTTQPTVTTGQMVEAQSTARGALIVATGVDTLNAAVTGTVTANQGTANSTANAWPTKVTDGTNTAAVKAASTAPVAADPALVVAISPNSSITVTATEASIGANGATAPTSSTQVGGTDSNGKLQPLKVSTTGVVIVDGSAVTQPVSGTVTVQQATAANLNAQVQGAAASGAAKSGNPVQTGGVFNTTQPTVTTGQAVELQASARGALIVATGVDTLNAAVTGTVIANQGTANSTANAWPTKVTDGTNTAAVKAASTAAVAADPSLVVGFSPNSPLPTGSNVIGAVTQSAGPWTQNLTQINGNAVATQANGELKVGAEGLAASGASKSGNPVQTGGVFNTTQPTVTSGQMVEAQSTARGALIVATGVDTLNAAVTGTVTANQGTANSVANSWPTKVTDGTNTAAVKAASTAPVAADPALVVAISPNSSITVTATEASIGTNGATAPTSSTQVGGTDSNGKLQPIKVSTTGVVIVDGSAVTQPVSGTVTVTQATAANLNAQVQGAAASGAAKSGNPVQTGGVFNTTQPTVTTGQAVELQASARGALIVATGVDTLNAAVTGTVTANQGTANSVANAWPTKVTDGTNTATVKAASTAAVAADPSLVVGFSPNSSLPTGSNVIGAVTQSAGPWTQNLTQINGNAVATQANGELKVGAEGLAASGASKSGNPVQAGGVFNTTQPTVTTGQVVEAQSTARGAIIVATGVDTFSAAVSGTVTANQGTANSTANAWPTKVTDGTNTAAVKAASTAAVAADPSLVTAFSPNSPLPTGANVIGAVTQSAGPWTQNLTQINGNAVTTLANGEQKVGVEGLAASGAAKAGNPVQAGGVFNTTQPTVTTGQVVEAQSTARGALIIATGVDTLNAAVTGTVTVNQGTANSVANAWPHKITDGTNTAAVKAASTAAVAADPSLVTAFSPNSPLPTGANVIGAVTQSAGPWTQNLTQINGNAVATQANGELKVGVEGLAASGAAKSGNPAQIGAVFNTTQPTVTTGQVVEAQATARGAHIVATGVDPFVVTEADTTASGNFTALNSAVTVATAGTTGVGVQIATGGAFIGTVVPEISYDGGTTWNASFFQDPTTRSVSSALVLNAPATGTARTIVVPQGASNARARVSAFTSGTAAVSVRASLTESLTSVQTYQGSITSYMGSTNGAVASGTTAASVTSLAYLFHTAASTKRIEITRIEISSGGGTVGVGGGVSAILAAQGSFITAENGTPGGTSQTIVPLDRNDPAADSTDVFRTGATGAPTRVAGTLIDMLFTSLNLSNYVWTPGPNGKPIVLRAGVAEGFEIRSVIVTAFGTTNQTAVTFYWTEI